MNAENNVILRYRLQFNRPNEPYVCVFVFVYLCLCVCASVGLVGMCEYMCLCSRTFVCVYNLCHYRSRMPFRVVIPNEFDIETIKLYTVTPLRGRLARIVVEIFSVGTDIGVESFASITV